MAATKQESLERTIQALLDETRRSAEMYASAHYRRANQEGRTGLGLRLETIERALVELARAVDELDSRTKSG